MSECSHQFPSVLLAVLRYNLLQSVRIGVAQLCWMVDATLLQLSCLCASDTTRFEQLREDFRRKIAQLRRVHGAQCRA